METAQKQQLESRLRGIVDDILASSFCKNTEYAKRGFEKIKEELDNDVFRITVVGEFSSGKSTFLNAMIGKSVLPSASRETTAAITYIHNVKTDNPNCNKVIVTLQDGEQKEFDILDKNKMKEFSTCFSEGLKVASEVDYVDAYVHFDSTDENILLIDTPGLNGMEQGHRKLTLDEIKNSNASICLFGPKGLAKTDVDFLKILSKHQSRFFFVQNCIDTLKPEENETPEGKVEELREQLKKTLYNDEKEPEYVFGISALKALVGRDKKMNKLYQDDEKEVNDEDRERLLEESGFIQLEKTIFDFINSDERIFTFYGSIVQQSLEILNVISSQQEENKNLLELRMNEDSINEYLNELKELKAQGEQQMEEFSKQIEGKVQSRLSDVEKEVLQFVEKDLDSKRLSMNYDVNKIEDIEKLKSYCSLDIMRLLNYFQIEEQDKIDKSIDNKTVEKMIDLIDEMSRRLPSLNISRDQRSFNISATVGENQTFNFRVDANKRKADIQEQIDSLQRKKEILNENLQEAKRNEREIENIDNQISNAYRQKRWELNNMGSRPEADLKYRTVTRRRSGIVGFFAGLIGCREYKDKEAYWDDSEGEAWDEQRQDIIDEYDNQIEDLEAQRDALEDIYESSNSIESSIRNTEEQLRSQKARLAEEERNIQIQETLQKQEFLKKMKNSAANQINDILYPGTGSLYKMFRERIVKRLEKRQVDAENEMRKQFEDNKKSFLDKINSLIATETNSINASDLGMEYNLAETELKEVNNIINSINKLVEDYGLRK